jgi:hypothetical protein
MENNRCEKWLKSLSLRESCRDDAIAFGNRIFGSERRPLKGLRNKANSTDRLPQLRLETGTTPSNIR